MSVKKTRADQLISNPLLSELIHEYERRLYMEWLDCTDVEQRERLWAKANCSIDLRTYIGNKCEEILSAP